MLIFKKYIFKKYIRYIYIYNILISFLIVYFEVPHIVNNYIYKKISGIYFTKKDYLQNINYQPKLSTFLLNKSKCDIIFLGDSITERCNFYEFYDEKVLNRGISGDTSEGIMHRIEEVTSHSPKTIFLMVGINDLVKGVEMNTIVKNIEVILNKLSKNLPETNIFLQSVLPTNIIKLNNIKELNIALKKLTNNFSNVIFLDLTPYFLDENQNIVMDFYSNDKIHLNGNGYKQLIKIQKKIYMKQNK